MTFIAFIEVGVRVLFICAFVILVLVFLVALLLSETLLAKTVVEDVLGCVRQYGLLYPIQDTMCLVLIHLDMHARFYGL